MRKPIIFLAVAALVALGAILSLRADWSTVAEGVAMQSTMLAPSRSEQQPPLVASVREPVRFSGAYDNDGVIDQSRLASTSDAVEVVSTKDTVRVMLTEGDGVVFDMDPSTNTTVLGRDAVIPPIHVTRGEESGVAVMVIENPAANEARQLLASKLRSGERLDANVFHRGDLAGQDNTMVR